MLKVAAKDGLGPSPFLEMKINRNGVRRRRSRAIVSANGDALPVTLSFFLLVFANKVADSARHGADDELSSQLAPLAFAFFSEIDNRESA